MGSGQDPEQDIQALGRAAVERARRDVEAFGWHVVMVSGGGDPGFLFTIGLWKTYGHPEILLFTPGEDPRGMAGRLQAVAQRVKAGETFEDEALQEGLFGPYPGTFRPVAQGWYPYFLGTALAFYESYDFPVLQLFWPDQAGRFPWEPDFTLSLAPFQPLLHETTTNLANLPPGVAAEVAESAELRTVSLSSDDLFVDLDEEAADGLLEDWRWLVGDGEAQVFHVTVFGDLFLQRKDGRIYRLETGRAFLEEVAEDVEDWAEQASVHGPRWFHLPVFLSLRSLGMTLVDDQIYGWRHPLFLGGAEDADNVALVSAPAHIRHLGRLAESVKDLPPGTPVGGVNFEPV
ncbi:MAG TPA: DUF4262 domain-containing protein [Thermoanaerobaculia bacterium]|jgi:hypothetical protein|nr:DUF4262 domain-containing protein [Thermoanaerobaculia bacterium]